MDRIEADSHVDGVAPTPTPLLANALRQLSDAITTTARTQHTCTRQDLIAPESVLIPGSGLAVNNVYNEMR